MAGDKALLQQLWDIYQDKERLQAECKIKDQRIEQLEAELRKVKMETQQQEQKWRQFAQEELERFSNQVAEFYCKHIAALVANAQNQKSKQNKLVTDASTSTDVEAAVKEQEAVKEEEEPVVVVEEAEEEEKEATPAEVQEPGSEP